MGELHARDGTPLSFTSYKSKDGVTVTVISGRFNSPDRANAEVSAQMKEARSIVSKESQADRRGKINHQRVVAMIPGNNPSSANTAILWTNAEEFHEVVSSSMKAAIDWERKISPNAKNK